MVALVEWTKSESRPAAYSTNGLSLFFYHLQSAPGIQRVIYFKLVFQILHVFREAQTITRGNGFQSTPDGICVNIFRNIRGMDDLRQAQ